MAPGNPHIVWKRRALRDAYRDERLVYPPPSPRSHTRTLNPIRPDPLSFDPQGLLRWTLKIQSPSQLRDVPPLKPSFGAPLPLQIVETESSSADTRHAVIESVKTGIFDAITVDDANKCFVVPYSRWVDPVVKALGDLDREARRWAVTIPGETFGEVRIAYVHHLVPPVHSIDLGFLHELPFDVHFGVSPGGAWSIGEKWFLRAWNDECSYWDAFKNFLIEIFSKYGIAFVVKKTGLNVAQWAWGVSAALVVGPLLFFAGLLLGTKLGDKATRLAFEFAQTRLVEHERLMRGELDLRLKKGLQDLANARTKHAKALMESSDQSKEAATNALKKLRDKEADTLAKASDATVAALKRLIGALQRDERRRVPCYTRPILERCVHSNKAEILRRWGSCGQTRIEEGIECFDDPDLFHRFERFRSWLVSFDIDYKPLRRAVDAFTQSMESIEVSRLAVCRNFEAQHGKIARTHVRQFEEETGAIISRVRREGEAAIARAEQLIADLKDQGRAIGIHIEVDRPWGASSPGFAT